MSDDALQAFFAKLITSLKKTTFWLKRLLKLQPKIGLRREDGNPRYLAVWPVFTLGSRTAGLNDEESPQARPNRSPNCCPGELSNCHPALNKSATAEICDASGD